MAAIQVYIFDQRGLDVNRLAAVIQEHYVTPEGRNVKVKVGQGIYRDGCPEGSLRLVDRDTSVAGGPRPADARSDLWDNRMDPPPVTEDWDRASIVDRLQ